MPDHLRQLHALAKLLGVQTSYYDVAKHRQRASADSLVAALRAFGVDIASVRDAPQALAHWQRTLASHGVEPVTVVWDGAAVPIDVRLPAGEIHGRLSCVLELENGDVQTNDYELDQFPALHPSEEETGPGFLARRLQLPAGTPPGYHRLVLETHGHRFESLIISAPRRAWSPPAGDPLARTWGCFLPLYALRSERNWGAGDYSDLEAMAAWIEELGGRVVGTLPLLAGYLDEPYDPSPYAPVSRLFWNPFSIDVTRVPELSQCAEARELVESAEAAEKIGGLREADLVDYRGLMALKWSVLERLAEWFFNDRPPDRFAEFQRFLEEKPQTEDYARFRAVRDRQGRKPWFEWPGRLRDGQVTDEDGDAHVRQYHLYVQWIAAEQLEALHRTTGQAGAALYLDLPLGVRSDGYDVWRNQQSFAVEAAAGAPPDAFFTKGQNWGFSPLHPVGVREQHYRPVRDFLHHQLHFARLLRVDHVMGLHRLYWIPHGLPADQGIYVQYRSEELYGIINLESHRHEAAIIGENLGTVPSYVNRALKRHRIRPMYVVQYEVQPDADAPLPPVPTAAAASLNTHDMPTFAAWWNAWDVPDRVALGLMTDAEAADEQARRREMKENLAAWLRRHGWMDAAGDASADEPGQALAVLRGCLKYLAASPAQFVLVNLEDLWLEPQPQNTPGTFEERVNWRRKARYTLEEIRQRPEVVEMLQAIDRVRRETGRKAAR